MPRLAERGSDEPRLRLGPPRWRARATQRSLVLSVLAALLLSPSPAFRSGQGAVQARTADLAPAAIQRAFRYEALEEADADQEDARARARRTLAFRRDWQAHGPDPAGTRRDTHDIALDAAVLVAPWDGAPEGTTHPLLAVDGDESTAWRGAEGRSLWVLTLPFQRVVHASLLRAYFGDASNQGVPSVYRWEYQPPARGRCVRDLPFALAPGGAIDDRDPNQFVHGPNTVHARRQALSPDVDACALRLVIVGSQGGPPVLRELHILEGARSLTADAGVRAEADATADRPSAASIAPRNVLDGRYKTLWSGEPGRPDWSLTIVLPEPRLVDRIGLTLGLDAVTVAREDGPGRSFAVAAMPLSYRLSASPDDDPSHAKPIPEADPPLLDGAPLPVRRRLVQLSEPRLVRRLTMTITDATDPFGGHDPATRAPIVRDIRLYDAHDDRPAVTPPVFWSVDANPSAVTHRLRWGEEGADGQFARDDYHRLERILLGLTNDTGWPADASRPRDAGRGRYVEAIEGDDPLLDRPLIEAQFPPPVLILSGSFNWDFDEHTAPPPPLDRSVGDGLGYAPGAPLLSRSEDQVPYRWNVLARASDPDRGMGQLIDMVHDRAAPLIGLCGGAHILGLFEAAGRYLARDPTEQSRGGGSDEASLPVPAKDLIDSVLARNVNRPIRPVFESERLYERAWWTDAPAADPQRPIVFFDPKDPLFATVPREADVLRATSRELPLSHMDMLRASAFEPGGLLDRLHISASSDFCRPYVADGGPEPTFAPPRDLPPGVVDPGARCVRVPQAFRSTDSGRFPLIGLQFHPEQRDLTRLASGSPSDARGDALNVFADAVDIILDSYVRLVWPHS